MPEKALASGRAGAVPVALCPCARERLQRKRIGRRWRNRASQARSGRVTARNEQEQAAWTGKSGVQIVGRPEESITEKRI
jgi:hypothetical protein